MKLQPKFYLMGRLLTFIGAAIFLSPLTAQALTGPDLSATKVCVVTGQSVLCTVTVKNNGQVPSVSPLSLTDTTTGAPAGAMYTGAGGTLPVMCSAGAGPVTSAPIPCTANTSLAPNQSGTITFSFNVPQGGTFQNCATVSQASNVATLPDPNLANNTSCTKITVGGGGGEGHLTIKKIVINNLGVPTPSTFSMTATCTPPPTGSPQNFPLSVPANNGVSVAAPITANSNCTVNEPPQQLQLASIPKVEACKGASASWITSYSPASVTIAANGTFVLTVTNKLECDKPTGGTLQIHKSVVNTLGVSTPTSFNMTATCSGMAPVLVSVPVNNTVTVPPSGQIPDGTVCTIAETAVQVIGVRACPSGTATWVPSNPGPLTIHTAQTTGTIITNTLTCDTLQKPVRFEIRKSTGAASIPGTYTFNVTCTGPGGPYAGPNPVTITLPGSGSATATVPFGDTCTVTEASLLAPWVAPTFTGSGLAVAAAGGWAASVGPVTAMGGVLLVANRQVQEKAAFTIRKNTGATVIPGTYVFNLSCTVGGAPVSVTSPVSIMLPGTGFTTIGVPSGATCVVTEQSPGANWNLSPVFTGSSGLTVIPGGGLVATVGPVTGLSGVVTVMNDRKPISEGCPDRTQTTIGCRVTVTMKRAKGPATYSVIPSQAATYPMSNTPPSTGAACVIPANAMINQTTCWFNYSASSTMVTLTTASSSGLPPLANWTGDCIASSSATCSMPAVTQATPRSVVVTFP